MPLAVLDQSTLCLKVIRKIQLVLIPINIAGTVPFFMPIPLSWHLLN